MASNASSGDEGITGINVTPLVDITLVLLIVFMVTAKLIAGQGMELDLPKAASARAVQTVFTVSIGTDGHLDVNGQPLSDVGSLRARAGTALAATPELRAVIQASKASSHGRVLSVMDQLRLAGLTRIAFAAEPPLEGSQP